jgi:hypothetical protein
LELPTNSDVVVNQKFISLSLPPVKAPQAEHMDACNLIGWLENPSCSHTVNLYGPCKDYVLVSRRNWTLTTGFHLATPLQMLRF